ncbi:hypothetical protein HOV93_00280 [Planctomycetes bacterium FF15]|uniref:Uncharacterized protein n=1 Tax=Bremerella alba TaxID=980252 RepID=A0A7V8V0V4_9BACT|nr:hypothetical protein [Bremerella alba]
MLPASHILVSYCRVSRVFDTLVTRVFRHKTVFTYSSGTIIDVASATELSSFILEIQILSPHKLSPNFQALATATSLGKIGFRAIKKHIALVAAW